MGKGRKKNKDKQIYHKKKQWKHGKWLNHRSSPNQQRQHEAAHHPVSPVPEGYADYFGAVFVRGSLVLQNNINPRGYLFEVDFFVCTLPLLGSLEAAAKPGW